MGMIQMVMRAALILLMGAVTFSASGQMVTDDNGASLIIRSTVADLGQDEFTWTPASFAGFYYDIDGNFGNEKITFALSDVDASKSTATLDDSEGARGASYRTVAQNKDFRFKGWGGYRITGFLGDECFAGYIQDDSRPKEEQIPYARSTDPDSMVKGQLQRVLMDDDTERTLIHDSPLQLQEGYVLDIKSFDQEKGELDLELSKNGSIVDSMALAPSKDGATMSDKTYYYRQSMGSQKDLVIIAVHFKNAFRVSEAVATMDGVWQISDSPIDVKGGSAFGLMKVDGLSAAAGILTMSNKDHRITLSSGRDIPLAGDLHIKVANEKEEGEGPLRYYLYSEINRSGTYEIRGESATGDIEWNPQNFAGFFYDLDQGLGKERLIAVLDGIELSGNPPYGLSYQTSAQKKSLPSKDWGFCSVLGFMGKMYLAGYLGDSAPQNIQIPTYGKEINTLAKGQLVEVLLDDGRDQVITGDKPLHLKEGYELQLKEVNVQGDKSYVELGKDDQILKSSIILIPDSSSQKKDTSAWEETYVYSIKEKDKKNEIIKIHFNALFKGADLIAANVDSIWQISENSDNGTHKLLMDRHDIETIDTSKPNLSLAEGYNLSLRQVDTEGERAFLELSKYGDIVDSKVIRVIKGEERTGRYDYFRDSDPDLPKIIEVDFNDTFKDQESEFALVDSIWQASEEVPSKTAFSSQEKQMLTALEPLKLEDGYELALKAIDINGDKALVELYRNGEKVETRIVEPSLFAEGDGSFKFVDHSSNNDETVAVRLKNVFLSPEIATATVDSISQYKGKRLEPLISGHEKRPIALKEAISLEQGYQLMLQSIDVKGRKAYIELMRNGSLIDFAIVRPFAGGEGQNIYSYSPQKAGSPEIIRIDFKSAFLGRDYSLASIERVWQARESQPHSVLRNTQEETIISATRPLRLDEGYRLELAAVDMEGNQAYMELYKGESLVDKAVISSREATDVDT